MESTIQIDSNAQAEVTPAIERSSSVEILSI